MSVISRRYVITPSVAVFGSLPIESLQPDLKPLAVACNAFLSRAVFHQTELHTPMSFYFDLTEMVFEMHQNKVFDFATCQSIASEILNAAWEYHFPTTDDILMAKREFPNLAHVEYVALARDKGYPLICTDADFVKVVQQPAILLLEHPWATDRALDLFPPTQP